jgi:outer membrane protein assembly factor BamD
MTRSRIAGGAAILMAGVVLVAACRASFQPRAFPNSGALFAASMAEYNAKRYDNAVTGFERLTLDLSARDTLLPLAHWYLAHAHEAKNEHLLAASSYTRLAESFPDDSLAPMSLLLAGRSYSELWRRPDLDPTYGDLAQIQFRQLSTLYPDSPYKKQADSASLDIDERKASKDYGVGMYYVRRKGYESSLIYFKDVVKNYPLTKMAHDALIEMVKVYRRPELKYVPEAAETCTTLRTSYPGDAEVAALCAPGGNASVADSVAERGKGKAPAKKKPGGGFEAR